MAEFPSRTVVVVLPLHVYESLAQLAPDPDSVAEVAATLLGEVVRFGSPAHLHAAARLAAQTADLLADRWQQRRRALARLRTELRRVEAALARLSQ